MVSIDNGANYNALGVNDEIIPISDRKIQIYFKDLADMNNPAIRPYVKIAPIMDLAGNRLYGRNELHIVENIETENVQITAVQLIAKDRINVVFNRKMGNIDHNDFIIGSTIPGSINVIGTESPIVNFEGKTEVVLTLDKELTTDGRDGSGDLVTIMTVDAATSESEWGGRLRPYYSNLDDKTAPEIVKWDHDNNGATDEIAKVIVGGNLADPAYYNEYFIVNQGTEGTITIYFSEDINEAALRTNTFSVDGFIVTSITAPAGTNTVILNVAASTAHSSVNTTVTQVAEIHDLAGNSLATGETWATTLQP